MQRKAKADNKKQMLKHRLPYIKYKMKLLTVIAWNKTINEILNRRRKEISKPLVTLYAFKTSNFSVISVYMPYLEVFCSLV